MGLLKPFNPKKGSLSQVAGTGGTGLNFSKKTSKKIVDPLGLKKDKPKKEPKTAEQLAIERRQASLLNDEIEESEERFKALARGKLGRSSLLGSAASTTKERAGAPRAATQTASGLGGLLSAVPAGGGSRSPATQRKSSVNTGNK